MTIPENTIGRGGIGILGFAVGFALEDTLSNFASGVMLLVYRPFDADDLIEASGVLGTADQVSLVNTMLRILDNRKIVLPNNKNSPAPGAACLTPCGGSRRGTMGLAGPVLSGRQPPGWGGSDGISKSA